VVADCAAYFQRNPYRRWFDPLDELLRAGVGASFYDGTACHLDLVQWATDPVWGQMSDERARRRKPWLRIQAGASEVVLNADTKRAAAEAFVRASATDPDRHGW
jgi:hypothetical protein